MSETLGHSKIGLTLDDYSHAESQADVTHKILETLIGTK